MQLFSAGKLQSLKNLPKQVAHNWLDPAVFLIFEIVKLCRMKVASLLIAHKRFLNK